MSITLGSYDQLGKSGIELMQKSMNTASAAAANIASGDLSVENIAKTSMDMTEAKVGMALGAYLVKTQNDLMESTLQIFGIGTKSKWDA